MDPSQPECSNCPLFLHAQKSRVPEGCEFGWAVYQWLSGPSLQRFGLLEYAVGMLDLEDYGQEDLLKLINELNACVEGESKALKIIHTPPKVPKSGKNR